MNNGVLLIIGIFRLLQLRVLIIFSYLLFRHLGRLTASELWGCNHHSSSSSSPKSSLTFCLALSNALRPWGVA